MSFENSVRTDMQDNQEDSLRLSNRFESDILINNESLNTLSGIPKVRSTIESIKSLFDNFNSIVDKKTLVSEQDESETFNTAKKVEESDFDEAIRKLAQKASIACNNCLNTSRNSLNNLHEEIAHTLNVDAFI